MESVEFSRLIFIVLTVGLVSWRVFEVLSHILQLERRRRKETRVRKDGQEDRREGQIGTTHHLTDQKGIQRGKRVKTKTSVPKTGTPGTWLRDGALPAPCQKRITSLPWSRE